MQLLQLAAGIVGLSITATVGLIVHELTHAVVLSYFDIPYDIDWVPGTDGFHPVGLAVPGAFATVTPRSVPPAVPTWGLKLSALAPLVLAVPFALVVAGIVPDPLATNDPLAIGLVIGWLACSIPSPQDFALVWHTADAIEELDQQESAPENPR